MDTKILLQAAQEMKQEIIQHRRSLHKQPEVGTHLPNTAAYVKTQLTALGYSCEEICNSGIVATVGQGEACILLRADMDALPIQESTSLPFAAENGAMHACGHDMHTAMLLGAAALLQKFKNELKGTVKLVFQPDEEGFTGAKTMLNAGVLSNPTPQTGLAFHVHSGTPSGTLLYKKGVFMAGCTLFRITVTGVGCHGSAPETGVDPINIATHIHAAISALPAREIAAKCPAVVTIGKFQSGDAPNILPETAILEGTIRTFDTAVTKQILKRIAELTQHIAQAFGGSAQLTELASAPPLKNAESLTQEFADYAAELLSPSKVIALSDGGMGSEDFAAFSQEIPCAYFLLGAGSREENPLFGLPMHNSAVVFGEEILPLGAALEAYLAIRILEEQAH